MSEFYQSLGESYYLYKTLIMVFEEKSLNDILATNKFANLFLVVSQDNVGACDYKIVSRLDGKDSKVPFLFSYINGNHKIASNVLLHISDLLEEKFSLSEICSRADLNNKTILGYAGKDNKRDKYWLVSCNICNHKSKLLSRFFSVCKTCGVISKTNTYEHFSSCASVKHNDKYIYSPDGYVNTTTKIPIFCTKCQDYFMQTPHKHLQGDGCPRCNESKGEMRIAQYLAKKYIKFVRDKYFKGLRDKGPLRPDFYLSELVLFIEFDGEGHYLPCFGSTLEEKKKNLEDCQRRDRVKDEWARENNIPLLRIPYWDFDKIEELIDAFILQHTKKKETKQLVLDI